MAAEPERFNSRGLGEFLAEATSKRNLANSALSVQQAEESVQDSKAQAARQTTALSALNQRRPVGGGRFGTLSAGRRGRVNLSSAFSGLDTANRGALRKARQDAIDLQDRESRISAIMRTGTTGAETRKDAEALLGGGMTVNQIGGGRKVLRTLNDKGEVRGRFI